MTQVTQNKEPETFLIELFRAFFSDPVRFRTSSGHRLLRSVQARAQPFLRQGKQGSPLRERE